MLLFGVRLVVGNTHAHSYTDARNSILLSHTRATEVPVESASNWAIWEASAQKNTGDRRLFDTEVVVRVQGSWNDDKHNMKFLFLDSTQQVCVCVCVCVCQCCCKHCSRSNGDSCC